jgi:glycolate oxidase iron-sulfur subunit
MRAVAEERLEPSPAVVEEMDFCLLCRHCESVCPAGVHFGGMMEGTRAALESGRGRSLAGRLARWLGFRVLLPHRPALTMAAWWARAGQRLGLARLLGRALGARGRALLEAPEVPPAERRRLLPGHSEASAAAPRRADLSLLEGCVMPIFFGEVNRATVQSLTALGHPVHVPAGLVCCGSLQAHNGDLDGARRLAQRAIVAYEARPTDPIVVNSAGCGAHLRELGQLFAADDPWAPRARAVAARVRDYSEVVAEALADPRTPRPAPLAAQRAAWDAPCHLCHAQQVRQPPLAVLAALPGIELRPLPDAESCCGSAGLYSLLRPVDAAAVLAPKLESLRRSGAEVLVTANPGCHLQWRAGIAREGLSAQVCHLAELVARAYRSPADSAAP